MRWGVLASVMGVSVMVIVAGMLFLLREPRGVIAGVEGIGGMMGEAGDWMRVHVIDSVTSESGGKTGAGQTVKRPTRSELIGLTSAKKRLGQAMPTGKGVKYGHVEGPTKEYLPRINDARYEGVVFRKRSGESNVGGHADATAKVLYGRNGMVSGVKEVDLFSANGWMGGGYLRRGQARGPAEEGIRVFTNSWIGGKYPGAEHMLRRIDYLVDHDGVIVVGGVNNGRQTRVPAMVGSSWNGIAVGTWGGEGSSGGYTVIEGEGRVKPDIVGPYQKTSFTTPMVAGTAGMLLEMADGFEAKAGVNGGGVLGAGRPEVVKAVILSGATKPWNWKPGEGRSLDEYLGAGVLNVNNSLQIMQGGVQKPGEEVVGDWGWDYGQIAGGEVVTYRFEIGERGGEMSVTLVWNRHIDGRVLGLRQGNVKRNVWSDLPRVADMDLRLVKIGEDGQRRIVGLSDSERDNVEHLYYAKLPAGRYELEVKRLGDRQKGKWGYGMAWRIGGEKWKGD